MSKIQIELICFDYLLFLENEGYAFIDEYKQISDEFNVPKRNDTNGIMHRCYVTEEELFILALRYEYLDMLVNIPDADRT